MTDTSNTVGAEGMSEPQSKGTGRLRGEAIENRDQLVLDAAMRVAARVGYQVMTREQVAQEAGVSVGTVNTSFGTMADLREEVICHAIKTENLALILQGLAAGDFNAKNVRPELKQRALATAV